MTTFSREIHYEIYAFKISVLIEYKNCCQNAVKLLQKCSKLKLPREKVKKKLCEQILSFIS